jgi:hypothetical protein
MLIVAGVERSGTQGRHRRAACTVPDFAPAQSGLLAFERRYTLLKNHALATAREAALARASGVAATPFDAVVVHPAFANAIRNRDRREIPGRRDVSAEEGQEDGRNDGLTHRTLS